MIVCRLCSGPGGLPQTPVRPTDTDNNVHHNCTPCFSRYLVHCYRLKFVQKRIKCSIFRIKISKIFGEEEQPPPPVEYSLITKLRQKLCLIPRNEILQIKYSRNSLASMGLRGLLRISFPRPPTGAFPLDPTWRPLKLRLSRHWFSPQIGPPHCLQLHVRQQDVSVKIVLLYCVSSCRPNRW